MDNHMTSLPALIEKLRSLKGPDREVDAEIMFDLFAVPVGRKSDDGPSGYLWPEDNPSWNFGMRFPGRNREWFDKVRRRNDYETLLIERDGALVLMNSLRIPPLTSSLDAVVALIERDGAWDWSIHRDNGEAIAGVQPASEDGCDCAGAHAPTPAIALLIAFLEAKMEMEK